MVSMLTIWTSINIKNTKRTQIIPLYTGNKIYPSFAYAKLALKSKTLAKKFFL